MEETYGVAIVPVTASSGEKARPRLADESWAEERKNPKLLRKLSQMVKTYSKHKK